MLFGTKLSINDINNSQILSQLYFSPLFLFLSPRETPGSLLLLPGGKPVMDAPGPGGRGDEGGGGVHREGEAGGELQLE